MERVKDLMRQPVLLDGRNIYDPQRMRETGFSYRGMGRGYNGGGQPTGGEADTARGDTQ